MNEMGNIEFYKGENYLWALEECKKSESNLFDYVKDLHKFANAQHETITIQAQEIERLRKQVNPESDVAENYFEGIEDIKEDLEDFANNPPVGDLEYDRVRIAGMADQCGCILDLIEKTMHHRKRTSEFCLSFMELLKDNGIEPNSTDILNAWKRAENKKVNSLNEHIEMLRKECAELRVLSDHRASAICYLWDLLNEMSLDCFGTEYELMKGGFKSIVEQVLSMRTSEEG